MVSLVEGGDGQLRAALFMVTALCTSEKKKQPKRGRLELELPADGFRVEPAS
jgi:hypothetical protein